MRYWELVCGLKKRVFYVDQKLQYLAERICLNSKILFYVAVINTYTVFSNCGAYAATSIFYILCSPKRKCQETPKHLPSPISCHGSLLEIG